MNANFRVIESTRNHLKSAAAVTVSTQSSELTHTGVIVNIFLQGFIR